MIRLYSHLTVCSLTPEEHAKTCNYWYTVMSGPYSHTAFTTEVGFRRWLSERGLSIAGELPKRGTHSFQPIAGSYLENTMLDADAFEALHGNETRVLSNGDYTLGKLTLGENGVVVVNSLNPNIHTRKVFDHRESGALMR